MHAADCLPTKSHRSIFSNLNKCSSRDGAQLRDLPLGEYDVTVQTVLHRRTTQTHAYNHQERCCKRHLLGGSSPNRYAKSARLWARSETTIRPLVGWDDGAPNERCTSVELSSALARVIRLLMSCLEIYTLVGAARQHPVDKLELLSCETRPYPSHFKLAV